MKKLTFLPALLLALVASAQINKAIVNKKSGSLSAVTSTASLATLPAAFSAYVSCWSFNKPCNTQRLWLSSSENILKGQGLQIFDAAGDNNVSLGGYNLAKRVLVTVICVAAPNNRTSLILNVFSDDGTINKTMGELFRQKFAGVTMIDCN